MCVCLLNVGVFTREDRHTDDMKNKQAGIAHEELKTDRKAWIFGGGSTIYIYIHIYIHILYIHIYIHTFTQRHMRPLENPSSSSTVAALGL